MPISLVQPDSAEVAVQFIGAYQRLDYGLGNALDFLKARDRKPSEIAVDLMVLAALVNAADTRVSRVRNSQNGWTREIDLVVPVSDPALWTEQAGAVGEMLQFLTGDRWRIFFRARPSGLQQIAPTPIQLPLEHFDEVCLFSGGLDSLIGAIDLIAAGRKPLLVSHWYDGETSKAQRAVWSKLEGRYSNAGVKVMRTRLGFDRYQVQTGEIENTQRGRSFVFFALAALAASALTGQVRIVVPENGLIGLNVPLDPLRLGALSTRTTHPHYLAQFNGLLARLGITATLENPYRHKTKGEMVEMRISRFSSPRCRCRCRVRRPQKRAIVAFPPATAGRACRASSAGRHCKGGCLRRPHALPRARS
ncbi:MAG TPA: Qat anti-phage system QueC-like protein QatC [Pseudaminobacter sp.]|nr:Qat anti-phage system QueC-like protein QatC [Pseudaminobacter sp.]